MKNIIYPLLILFCISLIVVTWCPKQKGAVVKDYNIITPQKINMTIDDTIQTTVEPEDTLLTFNWHDENGAKEIFRISAEFNFLEPEYKKDMLSHLQKWINDERKKL